MLATLSYQAFSVIALICSGLDSFGFQLFLEDAPLVLGPTFGPSVEFWVQLPLLKTQVHVVIAFGMTHGTSTKTPLTFLAPPLGSRDQHFQKES